jgi:hypothetical protein
MSPLLLCRQIHRLSGGKAATTLIAGGLLGRPYRDSYLPTCLTTHFCARFSEHKTAYSRPPSERSSLRFHTDDEGEVGRDQEVILSHGLGCSCSLETSRQEAMDEAETVSHELKAASRGLTVKEFDEVSNAYRVPINSGCQEFLELKKDKSPATLPFSFATSARSWKSSTFSLTALLVNSTQLII